MKHPSSSQAKTAAEGHEAGPVCFEHEGVLFPGDDPHEAQNVVSHATQNRPPTTYGSGLLEFSLLNSLQLLTGLNNAKCF